MQRRFPVSISLDDVVRKKLDSARGMIPRSRFIERLIIDSINKKDVGVLLTPNIRIIRQPAKVKGDQS